MVLQVFAVFDSKAGAFLQPFFSVNVATATREFASAAQSEGHAFHRHSGDYELFLLGEWDQYEGFVKMFESKQSLGLASMYLAHHNDLQDRGGR